MCKQKTGRNLVRVSIFSYIFGIFIIIRYTSMLYTLSFQFQKKDVFFSSYKHFSLYKRVDGNRKMKNWKTRRITLDLLLSIINILYGITGNSLYSKIKWRKQIRRQTKYELFFLTLSVNHIKPRSKLHVWKDNNKQRNWFMEWQLFEGFLN